EATFVVGNPGSTQRLFTSDQLAFQRELALPITVTTYSERRGRLIAAMESDPAKLREGHQELESIENSLKVYIGRVGALNDPAFTCRLYVADGFSLPSGDLFGYAISLVRAATERTKPNSDRFPGFSDSALPLVQK